MRRGFGLLGLVVTVILLAIVGVIAYNVGWSDGVNSHLPAGTAAPAPYYYGYGPGWGFGIFGFLWFLLIIFGIFWLLRFAFWGFFGRRMWGGGWGYGRGFYGGHRGMPPGIEERMRDWHTRAHGEQPPAGSTPPPPPDTRSV